MSQADAPFTVVILAADRESNDPVAQAAGVSCKALTPVAGRPMVLRVLDALAGAREVANRILCGPAKASVEQNEELNDLVNSGQVRWTAPQSTPSLSAFTVLQSLPADVPVLLTTADHALLSTEMVDHFCAEARNSGCDVLAGVASYDLISAAFPDTLRTVTKLKDGGFCGCNLFAFLTPRARLAADFWRQVENERKKPLRVVKVLGWSAVLRYLVGQLTLEYALAQLSRRMNLKVGVVEMPFAEAAVDVDKVDDWLLVESILAERKQAAS
ncbi:MAG: nucleotidyltransferase family protein [Desulfuromonadales bacterium]|nr:nucleotidyltransferase family protein [Desulfuromonadales bacterium]